MAHQSSPLKILAIGSPLSSLQFLVSKITTINSKHGPFDACVLVGDVFKEGSDGSEIDGLKFLVPTYFTLGRFPLPESIRNRVEQSGGEVVDNLVFLGRSAVLTTAQGLKVGCIGGAWDQAAYDANVEGDPYTPLITHASVSTFLSHPLLSPPAETSLLAAARDTPLPSAFQGLDLLLLSSPPPSLSLLSTSFPASGLTLAPPAAPLREVVEKARARYTFWSEGEGFWEREPWVWEEGRYARSVKLGALGGEGEGKKARWFYAFTLPPQTPSTPLPARPANVTPNPYVMQETNGSGKKRAALEDQQETWGGEQDSKRSRSSAADKGAPPDNYICKICSQPGHWIQECPSKADRSAASGDGQTSSKPPPGYVCKVCQSSDHYIRECPVKNERNAQGNKVPPSGYVCRVCGAEGEHFIRDCPVVKEREEERSKKKELGPAECWFCLSNPKVTKHLIVAIGSETYVTLPKGQLIPTTPKHIAQGGSKPLVPGGGHVLIIPIAHHPTLLSIPADDAIPIISELEKYKSALRACYASFGAVPVSFEIGRLGGRGGHAHIQVIPVPKDLTEKVAESFRLAGKKQGLDWEAEPEQALARVGASGNYFRVDCPDGTKLVHLLKGNFDLQFGRMVLGSLLGLHHRIDWKECAQSEAEEKADAQKFKKAFAAFQ